MEKLNSLLIEYKKALRLLDSNTSAVKKYRPSNIFSEFFTEKLKQNYYVDNYIRTYGIMVEITDNEKICHLHSTEIMLRINFNKTTFLNYLKEFFSVKFIKAYQNI